MAFGSINFSTTSVPQSCPADNLTQRIAKVTAYGLVVVIGLLGNSVICFIFCKNKNLRKTVNYFIFNMAVSDLLVPVFVVPRELTEILRGSGTWLIHGTAGLALCKFSYFVQDVSLLVSILSLLFMATERFVAIVFPMKISKINTRVRMVLIALTWITAMAVNAPYFYTFRLIKINNDTICTHSWEPAFDHVSTNRRYGIATFSIFVIVPFGLLVAFYSSIAIALRRQRICLENSSCERNIERVRREKENRKVTALSAVVVSGFALCYFPFNIYVFVQISLNETKSCGGLTFFFIASFLAKSASVVNPCTCFVFYQSYRKSLGCIFCSCHKMTNKCRENEKRNASRNAEVNGQTSERQRSLESGACHSPEGLIRINEARCRNRAEDPFANPSCQETDLALTLTRVGAFDS